MKFSKLVILFLVMIAGAVSLHTAIGRGWYPAAIVNYQEIISARRLEQAVASATHYYSRAAETYEGENGASREIESAEVRRAILEKLIESELILDELEARVGNELAQLVEGRIATIEGVRDPNFEGAVRTLYDLSISEFRKFVLEPKAREEILESRVKEEEKTTLTDFVGGLRRNARVRILIPGLHWEDGKVIVRGK